MPMSSPSGPNPSPIEAGPSSPSEREAWALPPVGAHGLVASVAMSADRLNDQVDPDSVARAAFVSARRGFDQTQVRTYLTVVSREIERLRAREAELLGRLDE